MAVLFHCFNTVVPLDASNLLFVFFLVNLSKISTLLFSVDAGVQVHLVRQSFSVCQTISMINSASKTRLPKVGDVVTLSFGVLGFGLLRPRPYTTRPFRSRSKTLRISSCLCLVQPGETISAIHPQRTQVWIPGSYIQQGQNPKCSSSKKHFVVRPWSPSNLYQQ